MLVWLSGDTSEDKTCDRAEGSMGFVWGWVSPCHGLVSLWHWVTFVGVSVALGYIRNVLMTDRCCLTTDELCLMAHGSCLMAHGRV